MALRFARRNRRRSRLTRRNRRMGTRLRLGWRTRTLYNPQPTFTETCDFGPLGLSLNPSGAPTPQAFASGIFQCTPNSIPQLANYWALYNQMCIRRVKIILIPNYTQAWLDGSKTVASTYQSSVPRMVYAVNNTSNEQPPTSELSVLTDNGAKIVMLNRPWQKAFRPMAQLTETSVAGAIVPVNRKGPLWFTLTQNTINLAHYGISYYISQDYSPNNPPISFNVYAKITFSLRDPK